LKKQRKSFEKALSYKAVLERGGV